MENTSTKFYLTDNNYENLLKYEKINSNQKVIFIAIILEYQKVSKPILIKHRKLMDDLNLSRNTIVKDCCKLETLGLIKIQTRNGEILEEEKQEDRTYRSLYYSLHVETLRQLGFLTLMREEKIL